MFEGKAKLKDTLFSTGKLWKETHKNVLVCNYRTWNKIWRQNVLWKVFRKL